MSEARMRQVLIQLELVSHGSTTRLDHVGSGEAALPPGERNPPCRKYRTMYYAEGDSDKRLLILKQAEMELESFRKSAARDVDVTPETKEQRDVRIVSDGEGFPAADVAVIFRCGVRDVIKARVAHGREPELGAQKDVGAPVRGEIRRLAAAGLSRRQIAQFLGVDKMFVSREMNGG